MLPDHFLEGLQRFTIIIYEFGFPIHFFIHHIEQHRDTPFLCPHVLPMGDARHPVASPHRSIFFGVGDFCIRRVAIAMGVDSDEDFRFLYLVIANLQRVAIAGIEIRHVDWVHPQTQNDPFNRFSILQQISGCRTDKHINMIRHCHHAPCHH